jgi:glutathione S-transferase
MLLRTGNTMQQACHIITTDIAGSRSAQYVAGINQFGYSKVLQLLGPPWARTFRCIWMLEELNDERKNSVPVGATNAKSLLSGKFVPSSIPYYLVRNARPLSPYVKKFQPTGKIPVLMEFNLQETSTLSSYSTSPFTKESIIDDTEAFVLSESSAINTYLYDQYGISGSHFDGFDEAYSAPLVPPFGSPRRGQYDSLVSCICTELDSQGLWMHRKHDTMAEQLTQQQPNQLAVMHAKEHFKRINQYLASLCRPYLLGQNFSAVDILYVHCLDWSKEIGWSDTWPIDADLLDIDSSSITKPAPDKSPELSSVLHSYISLCHSRPAYQRAVAIRDGKSKLYPKLPNHSKL